MSDPREKELSTLGAAALMLFIGVAIICAVLAFFWPLWAALAALKYLFF